MGKTYPRVTELLQREFEEHGVSKYSFCKQTGINPTSVERYLCGISEPNQSSLEKLAQYFKVSIPWLRGEVWWTYDVEVKRFGVVGGDQDSRPVEEQIYRHGEWERDVEIAGILNNMNEKEAELAKLCFDRFPDLLNVFCTIPKDEMDDAIEALQFFKNYFQAKISLPPTE